MKSSLSRHYVEACDDFTAERMVNNGPKKRRSVAVGYAASELIGPGIEPRSVAPLSITLTTTPTGRMQGRIYV